jgi:hypothetical protein
MKLLQKIKYIQSVREGKQTRIDDDSLIINPSGIERYLKKRLKNIRQVKIEIVNQYEKKRVLRVFDVIEPRKKIVPKDSDYPGIISSLTNVGFGETLSLKNVAVVITDQRKKDWKPIIEHTEQFEEESVYSKMNLICMELHESNNVSAGDYYTDLYKAGLLLSMYICKMGDLKNYDEEILLNIENNRNRTYRIGYFFQLCSSQYAQEKLGPICFGRTPENFLPTIISPTMAIDGAITRNLTEEGFDTYHIQNNSIIYNLLRDNNIDFQGVVIAVSSLNHIERERNAIIAANLFKTHLQVDGVIMTKAFGGASNLDLECLAEKLKKDGISFVPIIQATSMENKLSDALIFKSNTFKHIVCSGWTHEKVYIPNDVDVVFAKGNTTMEKEYSMEIEYVKGIIDNLGSNHLSVVEG